MDENQKNVDALVPADLKGRYRDFRFIGQGGMGRIVGAIDTMLDKPVAIKLLPIMSLSDSAVVRFHQEAKAVSKLNHQNIVKVLDFGFADTTGEPYLVMEHVKGSSLEEIIEVNETIPLRAAVNIAIQICLGLEHAHFNGVVHRDLKPANMMIAEDDSIKILDFGIARILDQTNVDWRVTRKGQAIGSPMYMSPEQVRGDDADERADVYGLGMLLYKMIAGNLPHEDDNLIVILRGRLEEAPPALPPNITTPVLNDAINSIIQKALAVDPAERYASMKEFREALDELTDVGEHVQEAELRKPEKVFTVRKEEVPVVALVGILLFCILAAAAPICIKFMEERNKPLVKEVVPVKRAKHPQQLKGGAMPEGFELVPESDALWFGPEVSDDHLNRLFGTNVKHLSLQSNEKITARGVEILSDLPPHTLQKLVLRETKIGDESIKFINKMDLDWLDLRGTKVTDKGLKQLHPSKRLKHLDLDYLRNMTDDGLKLVIKKFPNLRYLNLGNSKVTPHGLRLLEKLSLDTIGVANLELTDKDVDTLLALKPKCIDLEANKITDKGIKKIVNMKEIVSLSVDFCELSPETLALLQRRFEKFEYQGRKDAKEKVDVMGPLMYEQEVTIE